MQPAGHRAPGDVVDVDHVEMVGAVEPRRVPRGGRVPRGRDSARSGRYRRRCRGRGAEVCPAGRAPPARWSRTGRRRRETRLAGPRPRSAPDRPATRARGRARRPARSPQPVGRAGLPRSRRREADDVPRARAPGALRRSARTSRRGERRPPRPPPAGRSPPQRRRTSPASRLPPRRPSGTRRSRRRPCGAQGRRPATVISVRSQPVRQNPPWSRATHGHGPPSRAGRWRLATWWGWSPYAMQGAGGSLGRLTGESARAQSSSDRWRASASRRRSTSASTL